MDKLDQLTELEEQDRNPPPEGDTEPEAPDTEQPEPELIAGKYRTVEEAAAATEHAQRLIGTQAEEIRQLKQQFEETMASLQSQPEPSQQEAFGYQADLLNVTPDQLNEMFERGEYANAMYIASAQMQAAGNAQLQQMLDERLGPLQKTSQESQAERVLNSLKAEWSDETVMRYRDQIGERLKSDPGYFAVDTNTAVQRLSDMIGAQELRRNKAQSAPRDSSGRFAQGVHVEGGSTPAPQQATPDEDVDPEIAEIRRSGPPTDIFGNIPGRDAS